MDTESGTRMLKGETCNMGHGETCSTVIKPDRPLPFFCFSFIENSWGESHVAQCMYPAYGSAQPGTRISSERCNLIYGHVIKVWPANLVYSLVTMIVVRSAGERYIVNTSYKWLKTEYSDKLVEYSLVPGKLSN